MTIYKYLPKSNYTKFDNKVLTISSKRLTHGAKVVYIFMAHLSTGKKISYGYIIKSLDISESALKKYIAELKGFNLLEMVRVGAKQYDCYIGSTECPAYRVKQNWKMLGAEDAKNPYTLEDIVGMQKGEVL